MQHHEHEHHNHDEHAGHSVAMFRDKFWWSVALTIPVVVYSEMIQQWLHFTPPAFFGSQFIPFIFSTVLMVYAGSVFIKGAFYELKSKQPGMMTLIAMAISVAYIYSTVALFSPGQTGFFWELATLITIMILGHWLEMASIQKAESALDAIAQLLPDTAEKLVDGTPQKIKVSQLKVGDRVLVRPGSNVPADGQVIDGESSVNEAAITGESKPVSKQMGDEVVAGTINQDGSLTVKVTKIGEDTALAGIMRLVQEAQASKSHGQVLADKAAFALTIVALSAGLITFITWLFFADISFAVQRAVTVMIIACPHALGLAIPLVVAISTALSARNGLLVRKRMALESARSIDWVLFDKTGTLTKGEHGVTDIWPAEGYEKDTILNLAASLEQPSEHIIGKGIVAAAKGQKLRAVKNFQALAGKGVRGAIDGVMYIAASRSYLNEEGISLPPELEKHANSARETGNSEVFLVKDGGVIGVLALADQIREESYTAIANLKEKGIKTAMITGDSEAVAAYVAGELGIDQYFAEVRPEAKASKVKELQEQGSVAMVGDGINDAPALAQATIGIAIGSGTDVAIKSADIILTRSDPRDVVKVIALSQATWRKMVQNLAWATGYNVIAIPLAAGVLASAGIILSPAVGAVFMSLSTIVVAINAQLLRKVQL